MDIRRDDLRGPDIAELLHEHLREMVLHSPPDSVHALDLDRLREHDISFWCAWEGNALLGCGALRELDAAHGEIKSMRTAAAHLRKGVAAALLEHIIDAATRRGYTRLSLETGSGPAFEAAHRLYERYGFRRTGPFGDYGKSDFSIFMTLELPANPTLARSSESAPTAG